MFAGYGGASFGLRKANIDFECIGYSEIDKYAIRCFEQNFPNTKNYGDCKSINPNDLPDFDLLTGGFPCQAFSTAGKMKGEADARGTLFYDIIRIAEIKKPKYILLENVKGLTTKKFKPTFKKILSELNRIGYNVFWKVLNSKNFGIPQNRERVWFVCFRKDIDKFFNFQFPTPQPLKIFVKDILEKEVNEKYSLSKKGLELLKRNLRHRNETLIDKSISSTLKARDYKDGGKRVLLIGSLQKNAGIMKNLSPSINVGSDIPTLISEKTRDVGTAINIAQKIANKENKPIQLDLMHLKSGEIRPLSTYIPQNFDIHRCLQSGEPKEILILPNKEEQTIRRLTPKECFRLMGFLDDEINLDGLSDTQKYKLAGNGWDINLASKIFKKMFEK